jgi:outer membrane protein assembly factor BamD
MKRFAFIFLVLFTVSGCAWLGFGTGETNKSAIELAHEGMDHYNGGSYHKAVKSFQTLKDWYPFSKYAMLAELKMGDAHYQQKDYEEAIASYEEFENLHPRNEAIPYVIYQIGRCYFDRLETVDRDQANGRLALAAFQRLRRKFPQDPYALQASAHIQKSIQNLAEHEFHVGFYYYKAKNYKAAMGRFKAIIENYPDTGVHIKALQYLTVTEKSMAGKLQEQPKKKS